MVNTRHQGFAQAVRQAAWGSAGLLALAAMRYALKRGWRRTGHAAPGAAPAHVSASHDKVALPSVAIAHDLDWPRYVALCNAYYEKREFRVEPISSDADGCLEARLYFRKLPESVAILRYEARTGDDAGLEAMGALCEIMARNRVARGILHSQHRFGAETVELAHLSRIQLVSRDDLVSKLARLPLDMQRELLEVAAHPVAT